MPTLTCGIGGAYATLAAAWAAASNNDIIDIKAGTYSGAKWTNLTLSGLTGVTITSTEAAVLAFASGESRVIKIQGNNTVISNLTINSAYAGRGVDIDCTGATISGCTFNASNASGTYYAVYAQRTAAAAKVLDCYFDGYNAAGTHWAYTVNGVDVTTGEIQRNTFRYWNEAINLNTNSGTDAPVINRNWFFKNGASIKYCRAATIKNNIFKNVYYGLTQGKGANVYHNTFYNVSNIAIEALAAGNFGQIKNNIFHTCVTALKGSAATETAPNTNVYYNNGTNNNGYTADANAITTDPELTDPANDDMSISSTGSAYNAGLNLGITDDYSHNAGWRPQHGAYDIGALEYGGVPDPPVAPTPTVTGRRFEVHRIWRGGAIGTVTALGNSYPIVLPGSEYPLQSLATALEMALEAATGWAWTVYVSDDLAVCAGCGVEWEWVGAAGWNAWAGWADGTVSAGDWQDGTDYLAGRRVCAIRRSWPALHGYRAVSEAPGAAQPVAVVVSRAPTIDYSVEILAAPDDPAHLWCDTEEVILYYGTATQRTYYADFDGWIPVRPIGQEQVSKELVRGYAQVVISAHEMAEIE